MLIGDKNNGYPDPFRRPGSVYPLWLRDRHRHQQEFSYILPGEKIELLLISVMFTDLLAYCFSCQFVGVTVIVV